MLPRGQVIKSSRAEGQVMVVLSLTHTRGVAVGVGSDDWIDKTSRVINRISIIILG